MDKDLLFETRLPEADVDVPGVGVVRVRGLSRAEAMLVKQATGTEATERRVIAIGMVDPVLTEAEVGRWQKASPAGELEAVTQKISELSGMADASAKETVKSVRGESGAGVRVLPGAEAGDDGEQSAGTDER